MAKEKKINIELWKIFSKKEKSFKKIQNRKQKRIKIKKIEQKRKEKQK